MVKRGGLKRKIPIEKIETKTSRGPCYTKRCGGLFGKASQLCLLSGAQIAVLATPMSENSHVSFFSFGHSSVDAVVSAFLSGKRPLVPSENNDKHIREDVSVCLTQRALGLGFWWEDETLTRLQNPQELSDAVDSMSKLLEDVKKLHHGEVIQKSDRLVSSDHGTQEPDQTLNIPDDDCLNKTKAFVHTTENNQMSKTDHLVSNHETQEPDQTLTTHCISDDFLQITDADIMAYSQAFCSTDKTNNALPAENLYQTLTTDDYLQTTDSEIMAYSQDFCNNALQVENLDQTLTPGDFLQNTDSQIMANSQDFSNMDNNNKALPDDIDMDYDQLIDFETTFESLLSDGVFESTQEFQDFVDSLLMSSDSHNSMDPTSMFSSDSQPITDGNLVLQNRGFNDDQLHFSDVFNELTPIVTL